ncbi:uncharacterized protein GIQ15_05044 [Arthroderma uncinatum]|uniref:uncharacterized protein n=1 Tax=Arthroderma uncinatum TaxID=74035 RepID=UPI00144AE3DA|nr:uncharacterized protein GIQ15_05044 [Arthroderma uncinatum]KAF3482285.1 hypothetical protein GIQ15_05044 [Arthroderma uncinatum]
MAQLEVPKQRSGSPKKTSEHSKDFPSFSSSGSSSSADTPVVFSVFYGRPPGPPSSVSPHSSALKHVSFETRLSTTFIEHARRRAKEPRGRIWERRKHRRDCDAMQFREIASLASTHQDRILELWGEKCCVICENQPATAVVYLPICCTYDGYYTLADGDKLFGLMLSIAKLVTDLDSDVKVRSAIGSNVHTPYINVIAVPVCYAEDSCRKEANSDIVKFLKGFGFGDSHAGDEGKTESYENNNEERAKDEQSQIFRPLLHRRSTCSSKFATDMAMFRDAVEADEWEDNDVSDSSEDGVPNEPPVPSIPSSSPTRMYMQERIPLRYTVICGQPILDQGQDTTQLDAGRLTCLVFTSRWEAGLLESVACTNNDPETYQIIASFHERFIMASAEFRCCICPDPVLAMTLVHCPISFRRDTENSSGVQPHRQSMIRLLQYTKGRWNYPEAKAALGYDGIWHISDFVVPICHKGSLCEKTARIAARQFIDGIFASSTKTCYPDLSPDTDLLSAYWVENGGKTPKVVVERVGLGLFTDSENPEDARAQVIAKNNEAIGELRRFVKARYESSDEAIVAGGSSALFPEPDSRDNDTGPCLPESLREELMLEEGKIYTYTIEDENAIGPAEAEELGIPTWGGYPLCEESAKLVAAGFHETALMKPMITMDVLRTLKETRESIKRRYRIREGEDFKEKM